MQPSRLDIVVLLLGQKNKRDKIVSCGGLPDCQFLCQKLGSPVVVGMKMMLFLNTRAGLRDIAWCFAIWSSESRDMRYFDLPGSCVHVAL